MMSHMIDAIMHLAYAHTRRSPKALQHSGETPRPLAWDKSPQLLPAVSSLLVDVSLHARPGIHDSTVHHSSG